MSSPQTSRRVPRAVRVLGIVLAIAVVIVLLFTIVFPWFDATFVNDPVLGVTVLAEPGG